MSQREIIETIMNQSLCKISVSSMVKRVHISHSNKCAMGFIYDAMSNTGPNEAHIINVVKFYQLTMTTTDIFQLCVFFFTCPRLTKYSRNILHQVCNNRLGGQLSIVKSSILACFQQLISLGFTSIHMVIVVHYVKFRPTTGANNHSVYC